MGSKPTLRWLFILLLAASLPAHAQLYRWTDSSGRTHVTDTPPPPGATGVQRKSAAPAPSGPPPEPFILQKLRQDYPVTLYSTPECEPCDLGRKLLNARGIPFKEISVSDPAGVAELKKTVGSNSLPSLIIGSTVYKGYEEGSYNRLLDAAGYPKAGVLPPRNQEEPTQVSPKAEVEPAPPPPQLGPYAPRPPVERKK